MNRVQPAGRLWPAVVKLLRLRWILWSSGFRRARRSGKIGWVLLGLLALGGLVLAFWLSWALLRFLRSRELIAVVGDTGPFLASMPGLVMTAAFIGILFTSFGVLLQALYLAGDMDFLLSAPVPIRAVFLTKLLQAILPNFSLVLMFGLPVLFGLGASQGYHGLYYLLVLVLLVALALAAAGLSSLLVMAVVRVFPARRVAEVLGLVVGVSSFLCSQSGQIANWTALSGEQAVGALELALRANNPWSPLAWAGRGLVAVGEARWLEGSLFLLATLVLAAGVFGLSLSAAERLYYSGWAGMQGIARRKKPARARAPGMTSAPSLVSLAERLVPRPVSALLVKDFVVTRRDLRNLSQLIMPLILGVVYGVMLLRSGTEPPGGRGGAPPWLLEGMRNLLVFGNVGIALFVAWTLLSRLALAAFSQEGPSYWLVKTAPVSARQLLAAKYLAAYLPGLLLSWIFVLAVGIAQRAGAGVLLYSLAMTALIVAGAAGLYLAFGVTGARLDWQEPRQMIRTGAGCWSQVVTLLFIASSLALFAGPPLLTGFLGLPAAVGFAIGLILGGTYSMVCGFLPLWKVSSRVSRLGDG